MWHMSACYPLCTACLFRSSSATKVVDAEIGEGELRDKVFEIADAPASFKSDT